MYLFRAPNCTYYTRICLSKSLRDRGFPFDLKISLLTKSRSTAVIRHFEIAPALKILINSVSLIENSEDFKGAVDQRVDVIRQKFETSAVIGESGCNNIPMRSQNANNKREISNPRALITLADALAKFIESKSIKRGSVLLPFSSSSNGQDF